MTDVFVSYASADRVRAAVVVSALTARGWSVFWDRGIPPGKKWQDVLQQRLYKARCVIVLLTHESIKSSWVSFEASVALQREVLVPILLDSDIDPQLALPEIYRDIHVLRLDLSEDNVNFVNTTWLLRISDLLHRARLRRAALNAALALGTIFAASSLAYVSATGHNTLTMLNANLWHVERGAYSKEENDRLKSRIRGANLIELIAPNSNSLTTAFREDLGVFFTNAGSHMKVLFADGNSEFYNSMMGMTSGPVAKDYEASASDKGLPARSKQILLELAHPASGRLDFRRFNTEFRLPLILIDRKYCFLTVRLTPDQSTESVRLEFVDTSQSTFTFYEKLESKMRSVANYSNPQPLQTSYVESCKRHFDAIWTRSNNFN